MVNVINGQHQSSIKHLNWQQSAGQTNTEAETSSAENSVTVTDAKVQSGASVFQRLATDLQAVLLQQQSGTTADSVGSPDSSTATAYMIPPSKLVKMDGDGYYLANHGIPVLKLDGDGDTDASKTLVSRSDKDVNAINERGRHGHGQTIEDLLQKIEKDLSSQSGTPTNQLDATSQNTSLSADDLKKVADQVTHDLLGALKIMQEMRPTDTNSTDTASNNKQDPLQILAGQIAQELMQQLRDWRSQSQTKTTDSTEQTVNNAVSVTL